MDGISSGTTCTYLAYNSVLGGTVLNLVNSGGSPATDCFDTMEIKTSGGTSVVTLNASSASISAPNSTTRQWVWSNNYFGTTNNADFEVIWDDGVTSDNTPEGFTNLAGDVTGASTSTTYYATFSTTTAGTTSPGTGLSLGTTIDNGTSISVSNGQWSTNGTNWFSTSSTVNQNQTVYFRGTSSSTATNTPTTHSLTIGTVTRSFQTTTGFSVSLAATDILRQGQVEGYTLTPTVSNSTGTVTYAFTGTMSSRSASAIGPNDGNTLRVGGEWGTSQWYVVATDSTGSVQSSTITLDTTPAWFYTGSMGLEKLGGGSTAVQITDTNTAVSFTVTTSTGWDSNMRYFTEYALVQTGTSTVLGSTTQGTPPLTWTDPYSTITIPTGSLPSGGNTLNMHLEARLVAADGGDGVWVDLSETITASIENTSGPDVTVTISVSYDDEFGTYDVTVSPAGTIELNHSDVVRFIYVENAFFPPVGTHTLTVSAFDAGEWTNTSSFVLNDGDSSDKTRPASGLSAGTTDVVTYTLKNSSNTTVATRTTTFVQAYNLPDTSVTFSDVTMAANDTDYTVTIGSRTGEGDAYASSTVYTLYETDTPSGLLGSVTGHGDITVTTDTPPFLGVPIERFIYCKLPTASGGSDLYVPVEDADGNNAVEITRGDAPGINPPSIPGEELYGLAIYDNEENLVTFFTQNHTVLRPLLQETITSSTSTTTTISTGIPDLSTDNSMVYITGNNSGAGGGVEYAKNIPATIDANGDVIVARTSTAQSLNVEVVQYLGRTLGAERPEFGVEIRNQNDNVVMDNLASAYAVKEIIPLFNSSTTYNGHTITVYNQYTGATYVFIQLAPNRYPTTGGIPIVGISKSTSILGTLIPPRVSGVSSNANGSYYSSLYITVPKLGVLQQTAVDISTWSIAMLVDRTSTEPVYYGGQPSDFGFKVYSETGEVQFDSAWRQAIVTNVIDVNIFTTGTNQNGSYDVTTGYDGVTAPPANPTGISGLAGRSSGQSITITDLNEMDPRNTYLLGNFCSGQVQYYTTDILNRLDEYEEGGGGYHVPGVTGIGNYSTTITMKWISEGPSYSVASATPGSRVPGSTHPEGKLVFVRIT